MLSQILLLLIIYFHHETALNETGSYLLSLNPTILIKNLNPGFLLVSDTFT